MSLLKKVPCVLKTVHRMASHDLKQILASKIVTEQQKVTKIRKEHGKIKIGDVTIGMMYGGMRGIMGLVCETSILDAEEGIKFRGLTIPQLKEKLPKAPSGKQPLPEGVFWLMLTSDIPTEDDVRWLSKQWAERAPLPSYVTTLLNNLPPTMHPMTQLSCAVTSMNHDSKFAKAYASGIKKAKYWEYMYEDSMDLIAKIPTVAAIIYKNTYKNRAPVAPIDKTKDWSYNFTKMLGYDAPDCIEMVRLYLTLHCDHEGGNVSSHAVHLVGSALSDSYLSLAAGINGLAGPLHGLANQEVLLWLEKLEKELGSSATDDQLKAYVTKTLKSGQVVPGYGHAVLRKTDPRFIALQEFAQNNFPNDSLYKLVSQMYKFVPKLLKDTGKVANPWPNVDAHSGVLLKHYGITEMSYYTVMFAVSRALGVLASLIWHRALGLPIERPKSSTTEHMLQIIKKKKA